MTDTDWLVPFDQAYWVVPGKLLAGCYPGDPDRAEATKKLTAMIDYGIVLYLNLMEEREVNWYGQAFVPYEDQLAQIAAERGRTVRCMRLPIRDYGIVSRLMMQRILDEIDTSLDRHEGAYVHCLGGKGRTGLVVGCYLARHGLATGSSIFPVIQELRKHARFSHHPSPESEAQREMVRSWQVGE